MEFPDPAYLIEGELPVGYTLLMGAPKTGKTGLMLPIGHKMARAGKRVLYLALDDSLRRIHQRDMMAAPRELFPDLWYCLWRPKDRLEAFVQLDTWLQGCDANNQHIDFVIVDTYGRFVGRKPAGDVFGFDYDQGQMFKDLCEKHKTSVLVSHHTRKGSDPDGDWIEQMSGSQGMAASADAIWLIQRTRGSREGVLRMTSNDFEEVTKPLTLGPDMVWRVSAVTTPAQAAHYGCPRAILDYLTESSVGTLKEIEEATGEKYNTVRSALARLQDEGLIEAMGGGTWTLSAHRDNNLLKEDPEPLKWTIGEEVPPAPIPPYPPLPEPLPGPETAAHPVADETPGNPTAPRSILSTLTLDYSEFTPDDPKKGAIKASMALLRGSIKRETARYHPAFFTALPDEITDKTTWWEGRNKWTDMEVTPNSRLLRLDKNAAYLSAANTRLPIGALEPDDDPVKAFDDKRAGAFLVSPGDFTYPCGGPFHTRTEPGPVWIATAWLTQLARYHKRRSWPAPEILKSYTAPSTEVLLRPWIEVLKTERANALKNRDTARYAFVKNCYSLVISTMGESNANWEIRRAEYMHEIRSCAYALLWYAALQAREAGVTVVKVGNTDELWVVDDAAARRYFADRLGNGLGQWKIKAARIDGEWVDQ